MKNVIEYILEDIQMQIFHVMALMRYAPCDLQRTK